MSFKNIIVPIDGSQISFSAVKKAAELSRGFNSQLILISLVAEDPFIDADFYSSSEIMKEYFVQAYQNAEKALKEALKYAEAEGIKARTQVYKQEVNARGISKAAEELCADLIVMGSHGRKGFSRLVLGSFAQDVLNKTNLPVLIVKQ